MKIRVVCKSCGRKISEVSKSAVNDSDLDMYERSSSCEEHGGNTYEYDEEGALISSNIQVIAIKSED